MTIGSMDELITIQRNTPTQGGMGQSLPGWADYIANVWAEETEGAGGERVSSDLTLSEDPITWRIRYRSDKLPVTGDRVVRRSANFDIVSVREVGGRRRFWEIVGVRRA